MPPRRRTCDDGTPISEQVAAALGSTCRPRKKGVLVRTLKACMGVVLLGGVVALFAPLASAAPAKTPSVAGNWTGTVTWTHGPDKGITGSEGLTFSRGGTFVDANGGHGTWSQSGSHLTFSYGPACNPTYHGTWHASEHEFSGTMSNGCKSRGKWSMVMAFDAPDVSASGGDVLNR